MTLLWPILILLTLTNVFLLLQLFAVQRRLRRYDHFLLVLGEAHNHVAATQFYMLPELQRHIQHLYALLNQPEPMFPTLHIELGNVADDVIDDVAA